MEKEIKKTGMYMLKWLGLSSCVGVPMGVLSAFFLKSLTVVTTYRQAHPLLILGLPLCGFVFSYLYTHYGKNASGGNNLVIQQANGGKEAIPLRLIPLTLFGTIFTHLFGGSVGREGTAVQMGGSLASNIGKWLHVTKSDREIIIASGMAAGFSSVFGTPMAGTIFSLEVLVIGKVRSEALFPAFFAAFIANTTSILLGTTHSLYDMGKVPEINALLLSKLFVAALCFGLTGRLFAKGIQKVKQWYSLYFKHAVTKNTIGGIVVLLFVFLLNGQRYLGLSTHLLQDAFSGNAHFIDFLGKLFYTILSLGAGFQGGEVTPLFEIGATLGYDLAHLLSVSIPFLAGLGFIGVFAGATNTPLACFIMGIELFGGQYAFYFMFICIISVLASGHAGIYSAQHFSHEKYEHCATVLYTKEQK